jgi:hypothetical protein
MVLNAANIGGGLMQAFGKKKARSIDPEWLKQHFGANAVNDQMVQLFNHVLSGPVGQQLMANAAQQGQQFQTDQARGAAAAGMGPTGGADSGASIFSGAAAGGATNALQRDVKSGIMNNAQSQAQQMVSDRMRIAAASKQQQMDNDFSQPSTMQSLGGMISRGANAGMAAIPAAAAGASAPSALLHPASPAMNSPLGSMGQSINKTPGFMGSRFQSASQGKFGRLSRANASLPMWSNK